jgi:DNA-binding GntR family transcriptional regulator
MPLPESQVKLSRSLARDEAYIRLKQWIIDGALLPGEVLRDHQIAVSLGVSRTPVREALRRLEDENLVETALNRWTRVAPIDLTAAAESYAVIERLEILALELAFHQLTSADLQAMTEANRAMQRAADQQFPMQAVIADEAFHEVIINRAGNSVVSGLLGQLKPKLRRVELAYFDAASRARSSFREHSTIIGALKGRSLPVAVAALRSNWQGSLERFTTSRQQRGVVT